MLNARADTSANEIDSLLAGMMSDFGGEDQLDKLMELSLGELQPLEQAEDQSMDSIFEDTLSFMPEMESELLSFKAIQGEDSPDDLQVDELYSQLESLFGDFQLNKKYCSEEKIEKLDSVVNDGLQQKIQPHIKKQNEDFLQFAGSDESQVLDLARQSLDKDIEQMAYSNVFGE